jgi:hypothetical protein
MLDACPMISHATIAMTAQTMIAPSRGQPIWPLTARS